MKNLNELYKDLEKYSHFNEDEDNCNKFLNIFDEIVLKNDPSSIKELLKYFDDNPEYDWVLESMRCSIENFNDDIYVIEILKNLKLLFEKSFDWSTSLIYSILNNKNCLEIFRHNMSLANHETLLKLFKVIETESPKHKELIAQLHSELQSKSLKQYECEL